MYPLKRLKILLFCSEININFYATPKFFKQCYVNKANFPKARKFEISFNNVRIIEIKKI